MKSVLICLLAVVGLGGCGATPEAGGTASHSTDPSPGTRSEEAGPIPGPITVTEFTPLDCMATSLSFRDRAGDTWMLFHSYAHEPATMSLGSGDGCFWMLTGRESLTQHIIALLEAFLSAQCSPEDLAKLEARVQADSGDPTLTALDWKHWGTHSFILRLRTLTADPLPEAPEAPKPGLPAEGRHP